MAKFCTNCGKKLQEGEVCTCKKEVKVQIKESLKQVLELGKGLFLSPTDTVKKYVEQNNIWLSIILFVLGGLITGVFSLIFVKEMVGIAFGMMFGATSLFGSSLTMEIPYFQIFMSTVITVIVIYFVEAAIAYLVLNKCFKIDFDYKKMIHLFAALSIFTTLAFLISIVGIYLSIYIVYGLLLAAGIMTTVVFALSIKKIWETKDEQVMYTVVVTLLTVTLLISLVIPRLFG